MIQRIQSLYLLLVILLSSVMLYLSIVPSFGMELNSWFYAYYGFYSIPLLATICLFLYSKRKIQSILCFVLILFNLVVVQICGLKAFEGNTHTIILLAFVASIVECILLFLARRAIDKDEKLVRSIDRIR
jgi:cytochrome b561